jgi:hypothetical protein
VDTRWLIPGVGMKTSSAFFILLLSSFFFSLFARGFQGGIACKRLIFVSFLKALFVAVIKWTWDWQYIVQKYIRAGQE